MLPRFSSKNNGPNYTSYILIHTRCPAVLTETLFQDNAADKEFLLSPDGKQRITALHVNGIINYLKAQKP